MKYITRVIDKYIDEKVKAFNGLCQVNVGRFPFSFYICYYFELRCLIVDALRETQSFILFNI